MKALRILIIEQILKFGPETVESISLKLKQKGLQCSQRSIYRDLLLLEEHFKDPQLEIRKSDGEFNRKKWVICKKDNSKIKDADTYIKAYLLDQFTPQWLRKTSGSAMEILHAHDFKIPSKSIGGIMSEIPPEAVLHSNWCEFHYNDNTIEHIRKVLWAISNKKNIRIKHFFHQRWENQYFKPYRMIYHRGTIHIAGWILEEKKKPLFSIRELEAIETIELSNERKKVAVSKKDAKLEVSKRFGIHDSEESKEVSIKIQMSEGPYLFLSRRFWHNSQKFYKNDKGEYFMELKCVINIELIGWLFSWLEHVKVVSPVSLKKAMEDRAEFLLMMYKKQLPPVNPSNTNKPFLIG
jgi:predicted DNA-binding transcriptional regulator YafY